MALVKEGKYADTAFREPGEKGAKVTLALKIMQTTAVVAGPLFAGLQLGAQVREQRYRNYLSNNGLRRSLQNGDRDEVGT